MKPSNSSDPVFCQDTGWYFYDESWVDAYGPYYSEGLAREALAEYNKHLNGEADEEKEAKS
jgi:hypothetical protein